MTRRSEVKMGFWLQIVLVPGLTPAREREIERCLEDYADSHGLRLGGHPSLRKLLYVQAHEPRAMG